MTDGERISNWLNEYRLWQNARDMYDCYLITLAINSSLTSIQPKFIEDKIEECEHHMRILREKIMIYGDY